LLLLLDLDALDALEVLVVWGAVVAAELRCFGGILERK
jgi:hypothetical protein